MEVDISMKEKQTKYYKEAKTPRVGNYNQLSAPVSRNIAKNVNKYELSKPSMNFGSNILYIENYHKS